MIWESSTTSTFYYVANGLALNGLPTADDFEPLKDQIRAYEEIGGGGEGGRGGARGGEGGREKWRVDVKIGECYRTASVFELRLDLNKSDLAPFGAKRVVTVNQVKYECFHDSFK